MKGFPETLVSSLGGMTETPGQKIGPSLDLAMDVNDLIKACEVLKTFGLKIPRSFSDTSNKEASPIHGGVIQETKTRLPKIVWLRDSGGRHQLQQNRHMISDSLTTLRLETHKTMEVMTQYRLEFQKQLI